jgi:hypothetical protein
MRNPKQIQIKNVKNSKRLEHSNFKFWNCFEFRDSNFEFN